MKMSKKIVRFVLALLVVSITCTAACGVFENDEDPGEDLVEKPLYGLTIEWSDGEACVKDRVVVGRYLFKQEWYEIDPDIWMSNGMVVVKIHRIEDDLKRQLQMEGFMVIETSEVPGRCLDFNNRGQDMGADAR